MILLASGCSTTTITEHEGNYIYVQNEDINILDIDTRNNIGTLKMTGTEVLKNNPFTIKEKSGTDESGNDIYEDVTYERLVQVSYHYDSKGNSKNISSSNFYVFDKTGTSCTINPDIEYSAVKRNGEEYFVIALKNKNDTIGLNFKYNILQTTNTAKIELNISKEASSVSQSEVANSNSTLNQSKSSDSSNASSQYINKENRGTEHQMLYVTIGFLGLAVIALVIVVIIQSQRKK